MRLKVGFDGTDNKRLPFEPVIRFSAIEVHDPADSY